MGQRIILFHFQDEECVLLRKQSADIKSKYVSLKQKVCKYQDHQRKKEQKYLEQIRQTQEDCYARLIEVKRKTKEAVESKNKQVGNIGATSLQGTDKVAIRK